MASIPILNGIYTDENAEFRASYPVNLVPVPKKQGISAGFLRPADGIDAFATGTGLDRGGINWNGSCYRVSGTRLLKVLADGTTQDLGEVLGTEPVSMTYSFDRLAIVGGGCLYYWDGAALTQVIDPDLGTALDVIWIDGYFMTTDGENLVVTELTDPTQVNPLKYGSAEVNPDPVVALLKLRNEAYALGRYTIEAFDNVGGDLFPFERIESAMIPKGVIGTKACCVYLEALAFLGGGLNESPGIYLGLNASATKVSTREIDTLLMGYTEAQLAGVVMETRNDRANQLLYVHLPDRTLVYDAAASQVVSEQVWCVLTSAIADFTQYRARGLVWCYDHWIVGDPTSTAIGTLTSAHSHHWGAVVRWEFGTVIVYNAGRGAIFNELELMALTGRVALGVEAQISTSYSLDGETWSQERTISAGGQGNRAKRLRWLRAGHMRNWRIQRFRGDSHSFMSFAQLEAQLEPLGV